VATPRDYIEKLKRQLAEAEKDVDEKAKEAAEAIPREYVWEVIWRNDLVFTASCRLSLSTMKALVEYKAQFPRSASPVFMPERIHSMDYALISGWLVSVGGGSCILKDKPDGTLETRHANPRQLTLKELVALKDCTVPDSLKAWGVTVPLTSSLHHSDQPIPGP